MSSNSLAQPLNPDLIETMHIAIQKQHGATRQVSVQMTIPHRVEQVWQLITDYNQLAELIPNLTHCQQIGQTDMSKHLEMIGSCRVLNFWFSIRLVLEVFEFPPYQIDTRLIEGDLRSYRGQWHLEPYQDHSTVLSYTAEIEPKPGLPVALLEKQLQHLLPINFHAIHQHLNRINVSSVR